MLNFSLYLIGLQIRITILPIGYALGFIAILAKLLRVYLIFT